jgi:hypothetical protein
VTIGIFSTNIFAFFIAIELKNGKSLRGFAIPNKNPDSMQKNHERVAMPIEGEL